MDAETPIHIESKPKTENDDKIIQNWHQRPHKSLFLTFIGFGENLH